MQLQQYQTKEKKQTIKRTPSVTTHNFCSCGYVLSPTDRFCPQCGNLNATSNIAFEVTPEEKKGIKKQPEILSKTNVEEIIKSIDVEVATTNLEAVFNKFEQHTLLVQEKNFHQMAQTQIQNHFKFIKDKQASQQESEYLARITQQIRAASIKPGYNFAEASYTIKESEKQLMQQRQKENELLIQLEKQNIDSEIAAIEAEKKKRELEELQRQIRLEEERQRLEKEKLLKSFTGLYTNMHNCKCGGYLHENIKIKLEYNDGILKGQKKYQWSTDCGYMGGKYAGTVYIATLDVKLNDNSIQIRENSFGFIKNPNNLSSNDFKHNFEGKIKADGTIITGHWFDDNGSDDGYYDYFKFKGGK